MLYVEQNGTIRLTRGDTARLIVPIENEVTHQSYDMLSTDILKFTIKKTVKDYVPLVQKVVTGSNVFHILPADTHELDFGKYVYDVELTTGTDVYTVIEPSCVEVMKEVTDQCLSEPLCKKDHLEAAFSYKKLCTESLPYQVLLALLIGTKLPISLFPH